MCKIFPPLFLFLFFFASFIKRKPPIKFYGVFDHISRTCRVKKLWMIKLYLDVCDFIHVNKHRNYANWGLYLKVSNILLMSFCFMVKKDLFKPKLLLWPQIPFKLKKPLDFVFSSYSHWKYVASFLTIFSLDFLPTRIRERYTLIDVKWIITKPCEQSSE